MPFFPLLALPLKIRALIYRHVLAPTGYIYLQQQHIESYGNKRLALAIRSAVIPPGEDEPILDRLSFALLQTCRQIYSEAADIIYSHNTMLIDMTHSVTHTPETFRKLNPAQINRIRRVWISGLYFGSDDGIQNAAQFLMLLSNWNSLETVTVTVSLDRQSPVELIHYWSGQRELQSWLEVLRIGCAELVAKRPDVKRRLELWLMPLPRRVRRDTSINLQDMVAAMHEAFGGELWVEGRLCYRNGELLLEPFERRGGVWQVSWAGEGDIAFMAST